MLSMAETVLVTGGTGFVGGWCAVELLKRGYTVRATVRSLAKEKAQRTHVGAAAGSTERLSVTVADLTHDDGWDAAIEGCDCVSLDDHRLCRSATLMDCRRDCFVGWVWVRRRVASLSAAHRVSRGVLIGGGLFFSIVLASSPGGLLAGCSGSRREGPPAASATSGADFAGLVDIGGDRLLYLECRGTGSPTVVLVSGLDAAADLWNRDEQPAPKVFPQVAEFTRVCAYDRPGTPYGEGLPGRSDPVSQPTTTQDAVTDLHALLHAAKIPGPYVLVGHSYGGLITRLYASTYPDEVSGMVLVDILSDGLQDAMTPGQWETWRKVNARQAKDIAEYPDLEQIDFDVSLEQVRVAAPIRPMPLLVLSADVLYGPTLPALIERGELPPDTPLDFGYMIDRANQTAQANLAKLVPGAKHITDTHSGHNMMIDQPQLVTDAIREVVDAVRNGDSALSEAPQLAP